VGGREGGTLGGEMKKGESGGKTISETEFPNAPPKIGTFCKDSAIVRRKCFISRESTEHKGRKKPRERMPSGICTKT